MNRVSAIFISALLLSLSAISGAQAAKPQVVGKLPGAAYIVRCNPEGTWAATWSDTGQGKYTLYVVNTAKGNKLEAISTDDPGGMCWIPGKNQLMYCTGKHYSNVEKKIDYTNLTYYLFDPVKNSNTKITGDIKDTLETYLFDPIASEDGQRVFHMTVNGRSLPSFNIYFTDSNIMSPLEAAAHIGSEYDLSSDGKTVYWPMTNEKGDLVIGAWGLEKNYYKGLYEYSQQKDPAQSRGGFKVDSPNKQAVTMAGSDKDPTLKACVYSFKDPKNPIAIPVNLAAGEDVLYVDWKGRTGLLYMLIYNGQSKQFSIDEIDPVSKARTTVIRTTDPVSNYVDYASAAKAYFYTTVDTRKGANSIVMKVQ